MAVTEYDLAVQANPVKIVGMCRDETIACTTSISTTARVLREGLPLGSYQVPTGSSITSVTWYGANIIGEAGGRAKDEDSVQCPAQTVAAGETCMLPSALAGVKYILAVTDAAGSLYLHLER